LKGERQAYMERGSANQISEARLTIGAAKANAKRAGRWSKDWTLH